MWFPKLVDRDQRIRPALKVNSTNNTGVIKREGLKITGYDNRYIAELCGNFEHGSQELVILLKQLMISRSTGLPIKGKDEDPDGWCGLNPASVGSLGRIERLIHSRGVFVNREGPSNDIGGQNSCAPVHSNVVAIISQDSRKEVAMKQGLVSGCHGSLGSFPVVLTNTRFLQTINLVIISFPEVRSFETSNIESGNRPQIG